MARCMGGWTDNVIKYIYSKNRKMQKIHSRWWEYGCSLYKFSKTFLYVWHILHTKIKKKSRKEAMKGGNQIKLWGQRVLNKRKAIAFWDWVNWERLRVWALSLVNITTDQLVAELTAVWMQMSSHLKRTTLIGNVSGKSAWSSFLQSSWQSYKLI